MQGRTDAGTDVAEQTDAATGIVDALSALGVEAAITDVLRQAPGAVRLLRFSHGEALCHEGAEIGALYVVRRGRIKLLSYLPDGRARIVRLHRRGSVIGLNGLLGETHDHTAVAVDAVEVYQIPLILLRPVKEQNPAAYSHLLEHWYDDLNTADIWITQFSTGPIRGRVARLLLFLLDLEDNGGARELTLLSCEETAEVLGVTPESVSRVLAGFKRAGLLTACTAAGGEERFQCDVSALSAEAQA